MPETSFPFELVDGVPVVAAPEEIDINNAGSLGAALLAPAEHGYATFVVDMSRTQFCDSAGLHELVRAHQRAGHDGGEIRLVTSSESVLSLFSVTGADQLIPLFSSLGDALAKPLPVRPDGPVGPGGAVGT